MKMKKKTTKMSSGKMSAKDKFKAMLDAKKKGKKKMSITAAKPKVVKHKKSGRV